MRVINATCEGGVVKTDNGAEVPDCRVLSAGKGASRGVLLLDKDLCVYVAVASADVEKLLEITGTLCEQVAAISPANAGGTITPPTFQTNVAALKKRLDALKERLQ